MMMYLTRLLQDGKWGKHCICGWGTLYFSPIEEGRDKGVGVPAGRKSDRCHVSVLTGLAMEKRLATEQVFLLYVAMTPPQRSLLPERL
jgi:hypothetical protein